MDNFKEAATADQAKALNRLRNCYREIGQNAKAIELFEQALDIDEEVDNRVWKGTRDMGDRTLGV